MESGVCVCVGGQAMPDLSLQWAANITSGHARCPSSHTADPASLLYYRPQITSQGMPTALLLQRLTLRLSCIQAMSSVRPCSMCGNRTAGKKARAEGGTMGFKAAILSLIMSLPQIQL